MSAGNDTRLSGFYRLDVAQRLKMLEDRGLLSGDTARRLARGDYVLRTAQADHMIENVIGVFGLPLAIAPNFLVNGRHRLVPMVIEEPSVIAGVCGAARLAHAAGGFRVHASESLLCGQIQLVDVADPDAAIRRLREHDGELLRLANVMQPKLLARGGGVREIEYYRYRLPDGRHTVVLHVLVDTRDAMGANLVNTICEGIAPRVETLSGARAVLKILSNLADRSMMTARVTLPLHSLAAPGFDATAVRDGIVTATAFADTDPYRAATHNKGIMNGIDAVAIATGNDWRAIEAGAHAYAARGGAYRSLTQWTAAADGSLQGELQIPLKMGIVGGSLQSNPAAALGLEISGVSSALELAQLTAAVGLAQNFAALRALVTHGIQKGHMSLHARSVAAAAGTPAELFDRVVNGLVESGEIKTWKADELIAACRTPRAQDPAVTGTDAGGAIGTACGKVILLGEHAAVYDKHVLALPLAQAVTARVRESDAASRVSVPDWGVEQPRAAGRPARGAAAALDVILRELGLSQRHFDV
ncbi:MAG TPA: hydroxymethylglutaryl-CoA reductase, degradative, partial [Woeseiaceae bacterium]|nr:hydroxymethylglutaryl-CoA reductase, degradative [Woeseiaceae bacterium]